MSWKIQQLKHRLRMILIRLWRFCEIGLHITASRFELIERGNEFELFIIEVNAVICYVSFRNLNKFFLSAKINYIFRIWKIVWAREWDGNWIQNFDFGKLYVINDDTNNFQFECFLICERVYCMKNLHENCCFCWSVTNKVCVSCRMEHKLSSTVDFIE